MGVKVVLLVLCATAASARHLLDVNLVQPFEPSSDLIEGGHSAETILERRNVDYGSKTNLNQNGPIIGPLYKYNSDVNHHITETHSHRHHDHKRGETGEYIDNYNNIGDIQDEYKLRTNAYPTDGFTYTTEYTYDGTSVRTNIKPEHAENKHVERVNLPKVTSSVRQPNINYRHGDGQNTHTSPVTPRINKGNGANPNDTVKTNIETNKQYLPSNLNEHKLTPQMGILVNNNSKEASNRRRIENPKINRPRVKTSQTNESRPITSDRGKAIGTNVSMPKQNEDEEEIGWVWGTLPGDTTTTTEKDDLDNRAAFSGDQCPTGKVKIEGMCVETH